MVDRVATSSLQQQSLRNINLVQTDLATLNQQISSGQKAASYDKMASGTVEQVSSYQTSLSNISNYLNNNTIVSTKLSTMSQAVTTVQNVATQYASLIAQRRSANGTNLNFTQQAQSMLNSITQALNVSIDGRYLLSGSKTDTAPVTTPLPSAALDANGNPEPSANYYNGNDDVASARISDTQQIDYGVKANNPAFQQIIAAIQTGIAGDAETNSGTQNTTFAASVDLINQAVQGLIAVQGQIGSNSNTISNVDEQHTNMQVYWTQAISTDTSTDVAAASIQLSTDQTILQATFQSFAGLTKLKLSDYL